MNEMLAWTPMLPPGRSLRSRTGHRRQRSYWPTRVQRRGRGDVLYDDVAIRSELGPLVVAAAAEDNRVLRCEAGGTGRVPHLARVRANLSKLSATPFLMSGRRPPMVAGRPRRTRGAWVNRRDPNFVPVNMSFSPGVWASEPTSVGARDRRDALRRRVGDRTLRLGRGAAAGRLGGH
jgi:hypothetical protein